MERDSDNIPFETDVSNLMESRQTVNLKGKLCDRNHQVAKDATLSPRERETAVFKSNQKARLCCSTLLSSGIDDVISLSFWRACLAEFFGTFLLCFYHIALTLHRNGTDPPGLFQVSFGTGIFVTVLVSSLAHVSGCLVNPAVTLSFAVLCHIGVLRACAFICFQLFGAVCGSWVLRETINPDMIGKLGVPSPAPNITVKEAVLMEAIMTSVLVFVNVAVVDNKRCDVQAPVSVIVGLTVVVNTLVGGPSTGACMNPARAFGPAFIMSNFDKHWIFWLGPCCGGVVGALLYDRLFSFPAKTIIKPGCFKETGDIVEKNDDLVILPRGNDEIDKNS